jgi:hypothetical protein
MKPSINSTAEFRICEALPLRLSCRPGDQIIYHRSLRSAHTNKESEVFVVETKLSMHQSGGSLYESLYPAHLWYCQLQGKYGS